MVFDRVLSPGSIGTLRLPHRVVMGAMHLGVEADPDGGAAMAAFYAARARGGAGLIVTGGSAVSRVGSGGRNYSFVNEADDAAKLRQVADAVHAAGGLVALQLFHAGRYAMTDAFGLQPVAPSPVYSRFARSTPAALTERELLATIADFATGAERARALGFDAVEIMGSEGYLIDQFLSPVTNQRTDGWGGDAARRARFAIAVLVAVREAVGVDFPVIFRFTGADLVPGGTTPAEVASLARALAANGADALNVGVGWHEAPVPTVQTVVPRAVWLPVAAAVRAAAGGVPVIAGNRINRLGQAEQAIASGAADFVSMSRPFLADAALVAKERRGDPVDVCIACDQACIDRSLVDQRVSCLVNPTAGFERELALAPAATPARFAVVGGGPAGLEAARALAVQGHRVDLFEAGPELGGQFRLARQVPGKDDYGGTVGYFAAELPRLGVTVHLCRPIGADDVDLLAGYAGVVVASGVHPRRIDLPGVELPHVRSYPDAFDPDLPPGRVAIVGGGGIAVDVAHLLSHGVSSLTRAERFRREHGLAPGPVPVTGAREVTILHRSGRLGRAIGITSRWAVLAELRRAGVRVLNGISYRRIEPAGVRIVDADGVEQVVPADLVVVAAGQQADTVVPAVAARAGVPVRVVGGAREVAGVDAVRAFAEGLRAAVELGRAGAPDRVPA